MNAPSSGKDYRWHFKGKWLRTSRELWELLVPGCVDTITTIADYLRAKRFDVQYIASKVRFSMTKQHPVFFGHWRRMLAIAREQANSTARREADRLSYHAASIILSRTCLEIFFNELYIMQVHEGILSNQITHYSRKKKKRLKLNYSNFIDLHICERLELTHPLATRELVDDVSLQNQIRNYCIHYTASDVKQQLSIEFSRHPAFRGADVVDATCPQQTYVNEHTAIWCNDVTLKTVVSVEEGQERGHSNSELNIEHCMDMLS